MDTAVVTEAVGSGKPRGARLTIKSGDQGVPDPGARTVVFEVQGLSAFYGSFRAVRDVSLQVPGNRITALIGPSGCGKTTVLRCFNRMNDLIPGARVEGAILYRGVDLYDRNVDPVEVRRRIGMVFQKPNPFPKPIYDNIAFGPRIAGFKGSMDELVEQSLSKFISLEETRSSSSPCARRPCGTRLRTSCVSRQWRSREVSSSACASPGLSPWNLT